MFEWLDQEEFLEGNQRLRIGRCALGSQIGKIKRRKKRARHKRKKEYRICKEKIRKTDDEAKREKL